MPGVGLEEAPAAAMEAFCGSRFWVSSAAGGAASLTLQLPFPPRGLPPAEEKVGRGGLRGGAGRGEAGTSPLGAGCGARPGAEEKRRAPLGVSPRKGPCARPRRV